MAINYDLGSVSSYAIAVQHGFTGTIDDWVDTIMDASQVYDNLVGEIEDFANSIPLLDSTLSHNDQAANAYTVGEKIGNLTELDTENKSSLVAAINEAAQGGGGIDEDAVNQLIAEYIDEHHITGVTTEEVQEMVDEYLDESADAVISDWLDEHPEATTTVEDGSITQKKLAFDAVEGVMSPNLINESALTSARFTTANGDIQSFSSGSYYNYWRMTDYIDVSDHIGEYITVRHRNGYCFYNSNKTAIAGSGEGLGMNYPENSSSEPFLIPSDVVYVRLAYWYRDENITEPMANFGSTLAKYSVYGSVALKSGCVFNDNIGEKIALENIESDTIAEKVVSANLLPPDNILQNYDFDHTTGQPTAVSSGYYSALTDYIPVKGNTTYFGQFKNSVAYYDGSKGYISYGSTNPFTTPSQCRYVRLLVSIANGLNPCQYYLVEGSTMPTSLAPYGSYISHESIELFGLYKSVLERLKPLYNPTIKTAVGIYGDSNTEGLESGASGRFYQNCWANLLCNRIVALYNRDTTIYPFGEYGSWYGTPYSGTLLMKAAGINFASLDFYGSTLIINFGTVNTGVASITIDDNTPVSFTISSNNTQYTASNLSEASHRVVITYVSGAGVQIQNIVIHNYVTATNKGSTGSGTSYLPTSDTTYDIYLTVLGTNDRGSGDVDVTRSRHYVFAKTQMERGAEVILITPTPATDGYETGVTAGLKMAEIESAISAVNGTCNLEHISFYQYLLNYCTYTGTTLNSLFNDTLHLTEAAHAILYKFMCDKLGLGQPVDDYI